jgi:hypothetical protein
VRKKTTSTFPRLGARSWWKGDIKVNTELATRVEAVEAQLRRWKIITILALIVMTVLVIAAAAPPQDNGDLVSASQ